VRLVAPSIAVTPALCIALPRKLTGLVLACLALATEHRSGDVALTRFGANVREARKARGWTQEDLAARTGLATVQISRIERGRREIRLLTFVRLVRALDLAPSELLAGLL